MKTKLLIIFIFIIGTFSLSFADSKNIQEINEKNITIVVIDIGFGGLSIVADIAKKITISGCYKNVDLIFVNSVPNDKFGFSSMKRTEKLKTFSKVLYGIEREYKPNYIVVACNTLSALYEYTEFSRKTLIKVINIVDIGVDLILENLEKNKNSKVFIFGTETTISEDSHKQQLIKRGIQENRIVTQACMELQQYIETDPMGDNTEMLINVYLEEAISKNKGEKKDIYISLNCSQFGYSKGLWESSCYLNDLKYIDILDPSYNVANIFISKNCKGRYKKPNVDISIVSKVKIEEQKIKIIENLFLEIFPKISCIIINYKLNPDLF